MKKWTGYHTTLTSESYDAIIIGSGISGLTTAALLAKSGKKVLVLEKHFKAGGFTHTFKRKSYEWDVGIHYIGEVHKSHSIMRKLFDVVTDGNLNWAKMGDNYDRIIFPDKSYDFIAPKSRFMEDMISYFPEEKSAILNYIDILQEQIKSHKPFFTNKAMPAFISRISYPFMSRKFFKYGGKTTRQVLSELTSNEKLMGVLTGQWGDYGLPPGQSSFAMHAMVQNHYLDGGNYPVGGSRMIAETISDFIENNGGKIVVSAGVEDILVHKNKAVGIRLENGDELESPLIISSAGVVNTLGKFLKQEGPRFISKLSRIQQTGSYICLYMGLNQSAKDMNLGGPNLWIYSDYNHDENVARFLENPHGELPMLYVSFPSSKDPAWSANHPGTATIEAITFSQWDWVKHWEDKPWKNRGEEYETYKESLSKKILDIVFKHVPQAKNALDYYELSTPLSVKDLANYSKGELYGIDHTPERFRQRWLKPRTEIKNLYLTGQDIVTVGVGGAMMSGFMTSSAILKHNPLKT